VATTATSLKLPAELKERLADVAERSGQSPHAYMVKALEDRIAQDELAEQFLADAIVADRQMRRSGKGYAANALHRYIAARLAAKNPKRPRARRWRK
jgi:predicted transcriptional regulator